MTKVARTTELSLENIIEYILNIKLEDFDAMSRLAKQTCAKRWIGPDLEIYSRYNLSSTKLLFPLIDNDNNSDFDRILFNEKYDLDIELKEKNKIILAIAFLTILNQSTGMKDITDLTKLLLQSVSSQMIESEKAMNILMVYADELIKSLEKDSYRSGLIDQLRQVFREVKNADINAKNKIDKIIALSFSDEFTKGLSLGSVATERENIQQKIYCRTLKSFEEE